VIAIVFDNYGPYLWARVNAVGKILPVLAVELYGRSAEYAWQRDRAATDVEIATLIADTDRFHTEAKALERRLREVLDGRAIDAVAIPGWSFPGALVALRWCIDQRIPAIVMSESTAWDEPRIRIKEWIKRRIVRLFSAGLVGGAPHQDYLAQLGLPDERIFLGYDVVDNRFFADQAKVAVRRPDLPQKYFLASARFVGKKNLSALLRAFALYRQASEHRHAAGECWELVLLGDGEIRPELLRLRAALGLDTVVHLPGFKQYAELPAYYAHANAFIHASTTEQWGLVVNEAMASGLPVLVSRRCGCARDLVSEGVNGFTFDPCDSAQIVQLMLKVSATGFPLAKFGVASQRIISDWGPDRFAAGMVSAVNCALKVGPRPAGWFDWRLLGVLMRRNNT